MLDQMVLRSSIESAPDNSAKLEQPLRTACPGHARLELAGAGTGCPAGGFGKYFRTVRGETCSPNFTHSSLAIRSDNSEGAEHSRMRSYS